MAVLAHLRLGSGVRTRILLHGFLGSARNLTTLARGLVAADPGLSTVALDLTGHGDSPPLPSGADLGTVARDVLETAAALGVAPPLAIAGHSLGGRVALRAALESPPAIGRVTLLDIGPSAVDPEAGDTARVLDALLAAPSTAAARGVFRAHFRAHGLSEAITSWLLLNLAAAGGVHRWRLDREALAAFHRRASVDDLWAAVERARSYEVRCVRAERSAYVGDADARRLEAAGCPVVTLAGAGHFLHVDRPAELSALLRDDGHARHGMPPGPDVEAPADSSG